MEPLFRKMFKSRKGVVSFTLPGHSVVDIVRRENPHFPNGCYWEGSDGRSVCVYGFSLSQAVGCLVRTALVGLSSVVHHFGQELASRAYPIRDVEGGKVICDPVGRVLWGLDVTSGSIYNAYGTCVPKRKGFSYDAIFRDVRSVVGVSSIHILFHWLQSMGLCISDICSESVLEDMEDELPGSSKRLRNSSHGLVPYTEDFSQVDWGEAEGEDNVSYVWISLPTAVFIGRRVDGNIESMLRGCHAVYNGSYDIILDKFSRGNPSCTAFFDKLFGPVLPEDSSNDLSIDSCGLVGYEAVDGYMPGVFKLINHSSISSCRHHGCYSDGSRLVLCGTEMCILTYMRAKLGELRTYAPSHISDFLERSEMHGRDFFQDYDKHMRDVQP